MAVRPSTTVDGDLVLNTSSDTTFSTSFSVGSPLAYRVPILELKGHVHHIQANFEDGDHIFTSPEFELGTVRTVGSLPLMGQLTFHYSYDSTSRVITVCGTDYASADGMTLITMPKGMDQKCFEHAASAGFVADEIYRNRSWNYHSQLMPGAAKIFKDIARGANDTLIAALKAKPQLIVQVRETLPELPIEQYLELCVVYRNGEFLETYDHSREYDASDEVRPVESVFGGTVTLNYGDNFANVIGSTKDPKIDRLSWINLWIQKCGGLAPTACTSLNYKSFKCNTSLVGGHVVKGQTATVVAKGSNSVYIFPICIAHNNNDNTYMAALTYTSGVWLWNYLGR